MIQEKLSPLGVKPENTYLFIRGHNLYDGITAPLFISVTGHLKNKQKSSFHKEISRHAKYSEEKKRELRKQKEQEQENKFENREIKSLLTSNKEYDSCFLMRKIEEDFKIIITKSFPQNKKNLE